MKTFQLPRGSTFTYNTKTRKWSSVPFEDNVRRISSVSFGVSVRNRLGFIVGGEYVNEGPTEYNSSVSLPGPVKQGPLVDTTTTYNFRTKEYKVSISPDELKQSSHGFFLNLDRVGKDGVMAYVGGKHKDVNGTIILVRPISCTLLSHRLFSFSFRECCICHLVRKKGSEANIHMVSAKWKKYTCMTLPVKAGLHKPPLAKFLYLDEILACS